MLTLAYIFYFLTLFICTMFIVSGIDDLVYDFTYWTSNLYAKITGKHHLVTKDFTYADLMEKWEQRLAMLIPCWHEEHVIEQMLDYNLSHICYSNFDVYIGVYPNDLATLKTVEALMPRFPNIHCVINPKKGPTTKGDNLNSVLQHLRQYEKKLGIEYDLIVMNDAEDVIHPLALKFFNFLIPSYDMIQIPVLPLHSKPWYNWTYWTYCDEFAENHNKDLVVRNRLHGLVPSAGTGTALSRRAIRIISKDQEEDLFDATMFTEDYDLSYRLHDYGLKSVYIKDYVEIPAEELDYASEHPFDDATVAAQERGESLRELVAIREYFPCTYGAAVSQKSRWVFGIIFQEWNKMHWQGDLRTKFTLIHDRKAIFSHFVSFAGYLVVLYLSLAYFFPGLGLVNYVVNGSLLWYLLWITFFVMVQRLLQRVFAVSRHYGIIQGLLSIPRILYGNLINAHALIRAMTVYFGRKRKNATTWNKTDHEFPKSEDI